MAHFTDFCLRHCVFTCAALRSCAVPSLASSCVVTPGGTMQLLNSSGTLNHAMYKNVDSDNNPHLRQVQTLSGIIYRVL